MAHHCHPTSDLTGERPRVLTYPARHPHIDALGDVATWVDPDDAVHMRTGAYQPSWIRDNRFRWDLAHVHVGLDDHDADALGAAVRAHRREGTPVLCTVHAVEGPVMPGWRSRAARSLRAIAEDASGLLTFTGGAAAQVHELTGMRATVVPHGPLVPMATRRRAALARRLQPWAQPAPLVVLGRAFADLGVEELGRALAGGDVRVTVAVDPADAERVRHQLGDAPGTEILMVPLESTDTLVTAMSRCSHLVIPQRWGTHSPLIELAADLGLPTIPTDVGALVEQREAATGLTRQALLPPIPVVDGQVDVEALHAALRTTPTPTATNDAHRTQLEWQRRQAHQRLYQRALLTTSGVLSSRIVPDDPADAAFLASCCATPEAAQPRVSSSARIASRHSP